MSSDVGPPSRQSLLVGRARRSSTVSMFWKLLWLSKAAVETVEANATYNAMVLITFFDSYLMLSLRYSRRGSLQKAKCSGFEAKSGGQEMILY